MPASNNNNNNGCGGGSSIHANGAYGGKIDAGSDFAPEANSGFARISSSSYSLGGRQFVSVSDRQSADLANKQTQRNIAICATDLTFLWSNCRRCAYNKVVRDIQQPRGAFPAIFNAIDKSMKTYLDGCRTEAVGEDAGLPAGTISPWKKPVRSREFTLPEHPEIAVTLYGQPDAVILLDEVAESGMGAASAVCDFKTSYIASVSTKMYSRQLHTYAIAAEQPAGGYHARRLEQVSRLGLLVFEPKRFRTHNTARGAKDITGFFAGELQWVEVRRDDAEFYEFLAEVVAVLKQPAPPEASPACTYCRYVEQIYGAEH